MARTQRSLRMTCVISLATFLIALAGLGQPAAIGAVVNLGTVSSSTPYQHAGTSSIFRAQIPSQSPLGPPSGVFHEYAFTLATSSPASLRVRGNGVQNSSLFDAKVFVGGTSEPLTPTSRVGAGTTASPLELTYANINPSLNYVLRVELPVPSAGYWSPTSDIGYSGVVLVPEPSLLSLALVTGTPAFLLRRRRTLA